MPDRAAGQRVSCGPALPVSCRVYNRRNKSGEVAMEKQDFGMDIGLFFCVVVVKEAAGIAMGCLRGVCDHQQDPDRDEGEYLTC